MVDTFSWARLSSERMEMMVSVCQESLTSQCCCFLLSCSFAEFLLNIVTRCLNSLVYSCKIDLR